MKKAVIKSGPFFKDCPIASCSKMHFVESKFEDSRFQELVGHNQIPNVNAVMRANNPMLHIHGSAKKVSMMKKKSNKSSWNKIRIISRSAIGPWEGCWIQSLQMKVIRVCAHIGFGIVSSINLLSEDLLVRKNGGKSTKAGNPVMINNNKRTNIVRDIQVAKGQ